jgi:hypothetical protein
VTRTFFLQRLGLQKEYNLTYFYYSSFIFKNSTDLNWINELNQTCCRSGDAHDLYSGSVWFKSLLSWQRFFCCFSQPLQSNDGIVPRIIYDRFLPNPFQIIIHMSSIHLILCSLATERVIKKPQINKRMSKQSLYPRSTFVYSEWPL